MLYFFKRCVRNDTTKKAMCEAFNAGIPNFIYKTHYPCQLRKIYLSTEHVINLYIYTNNNKIDYIPLHQYDKFYNMLVM